jgi:hypothetical protein
MNNARSKLGIHKSTFQETQRARVETTSQEQVWSIQRPMRKLVWFIQAEGGRQAGEEVGGSQVLVSIDG